MTSELRSFHVLVKRNGSEYLVGVVVRGYFQHGWRFCPHVAGRARSRKLWPTAEEAIPRWVGDYRLAAPQPPTFPSSA